MKCLIIIFLLCVFYVDLGKGIYSPGDYNTVNTNVKTSSYPKNNIQFHHNYSKVYSYQPTTQVIQRTVYVTKNEENSEGTAQKFYPVFNGHTNGQTPYVENVRNVRVYNRLNNTREENIRSLQDTLEQIGNTKNEQTFTTVKRKKEILNQIEVYSKCPTGATGQFVYDLSCNQFLNCFKGRGVVQNCAPGTLFNPKTLECDFPKKVECITGPEQRSINIKSAALTSEQAKCPENFIGLIPNYNDCSKFINCNSGTQYIQDCPPGTLFDTTKNICDHAHLAICYNGQNLKRETSSGSSSSSTQYGKYTQGSYHTTYGSGTTGDLQYAESQHTGYSNQYGTQCKTGNCQSNCQGQNCVTNNQYQHGTQYQQHGTQWKQNNCQGPNCGTNHQYQHGTQYQQGSNNQGTYQQHGSYQQGQYHQGANAQGTYQQYGGNQGGTQTYGTTHTSTNYGTICNINDPNCIQKGKHTQTQSGAAQCPAGSSGLQPHPTICGKFLNCANGQTFVQDCGPGTVFNPNTKVCDFPYNVNCQDGASSSSSGSSSTQYSHRVNPNLNWDQSSSGSSSHGVNQNLNWDQTGSSTQNVQYVAGGNQGQNPNCQNGLCTGQNQYSSGTSWNQRPGGSVTTWNQQSVVCQNPPCGNAANYGTSSWNQQSSNCPNGNCGQNQGSSGTQGQYSSTTWNQQGNNCPNGNCNYNSGSGTTTSWSQQSKPGITQGQSPHWNQQNCPNGNCGTQGQHTGYGTSTTWNQQTGSSSAGTQPGYGTNIHQQNCPNGNCGTQGQNSQPNTGRGSTTIWTHQQTNCPNGNCGTTHGTTTTWNHQQNNCPNGNCGNSGSNRQHKINPNMNWDDQQQSGSNQEVQYIYGTKGGTHNQIQCRGGKCAQENYQGTLVGQQRAVEPIDNQDEVTELFDGTEQVTTAKPKPQWPPSFPDPVPSTDTNADYVFENNHNNDVDYEDLEIPDTYYAQRKTTTKCEKNDFHCTSTSCISRTSICDGIIDCQNGKDEQNCQEYMSKFEKRENQKLAVVEQQRWNNVNASTCAALCLATTKFECRSFNYRKIDRSCHLSDSNIGLSGMLMNYKPCDFYELKSQQIDCTNLHVCPNSKCISSAQICDGFDDCGDRSDEVNCTKEELGYSVKLAGTKHKHKGRIEVSAFGKMGYICDDQFGLREANVVCKELGFKLGAAEVRGNSFYAKDIKKNNTFYMMDDVNCNGKESSLKDCSFSGWGHHNCLDGEVAGIICKIPQEKCPVNNWQCKTGSECIPIDFVCDGLNDCSDDSDEAADICEAPSEIRLAGATRTEGRVEIKHHGVWGTICDDDFNEDAAKVICKQLGFKTSSQVKKEGFYGPGSGPIWLDQVYCLGNETGLEHCSHWNWGEHNCDHTEDVGVICTNEDVDMIREKSSRALTGTERALPIYPNTCGYRKDNQFLIKDDVHFRVVQGSLAKAGEYPWQAAIKVKTNNNKAAHWCGAIIISEKFVLTAAHCLIGYSKGAYIVVAGDYDVDEIEGTEQTDFIEEFYIHEEFRKGHKMNNDIALVKVKKGFKLNQNVQPLCLPEEDLVYEANLNCTISGFGSTQSGKSAYSHNMRAGWVPIQSNDVCKMPHVYGDNIKDGMFCAGFLEEGVDACDGDSGGPLACLNEGLFTLYGITSWGQHCGYANKPGVYVKVAYYRKWIDETLRKHS